MAPEPAVRISAFLTIRTADWATSVLRKSFTWHTVCIEVPCATRFYHSLTPWTTLCPEQLVVSQINKKCPSVPPGVVTRRRQRSVIWHVCRRRVCNVCLSELQLKSIACCVWQLPTSSTADLSCLLRCHRNVPTFRLNVLLPSSRY